MAAVCFACFSRVGLIALAILVELGS
jgi:hypothetical protein